MSDLYHPQPINAINGATSAATPPVYNSGNGWALVPSSWRAGAVEECDLHVWADAANAVTLARLVGGHLESVTIADDDVDTVDDTNDELDITTHSYVTGDGPVQLTTTDTLPAGLAEDTNYWVIVVNANSIKLSESFEFAMSNKALAIGDAGTGTHTVVDTASTKRVHWGSMGWLGDSNDGAITLTSAMSWQGRVKHTDEIVVYSAVATFGSAVATYFRLTPRPIVR